MRVKLVRAKTCTIKFIRVKPIHVKFVHVKKGKRKKNLHETA